MKELCNRGPARVLGLAALLLIVALAMSACVTPAPASPTVAAAPTQSSATSAPEQTPASAESVVVSDLPAGVDGEGNFYRGDPKATVKLIEFSDFQ